MNRRELQKRLTELGIDPTAYSLSGGMPPGRVVLNQEPNSGWTVYYSENGQRLGLQPFDSESAACQFLLESLKRAARRLAK